MRLCSVTQILTCFYNSERNAGYKSFPPGCPGPTNKCLQTPKYVNEVTCVSELGRGKGRD